MRDYRSAFPEMVRQQQPASLKRKREEQRDMKVRWYMTRYKVGTCHDLKNWLTKDSLLPLVNQMSLRSQKGRRDFQIR